MNFLLRILSIGLLATSITATAQSVSRVKSMSVYNYMNGAYKVDDSARFFYTGTNPGTATWPILEAILSRHQGEQYWFAADNNMLYDSAHVYYSDTIDYVYKQVFNNNKITYRDEIGYAVPRYDSFIYNSNGQLIESTEAKMSQFKTRWYYNSNNRIDSIQYFTLSSLGWNRTQTWHHIYNTSGQLIKRLHVGILFNDTTYDYFEYDINGFLSRESFVVDADTHHVYNYINAANGNINEYKTWLRITVNPSIDSTQNWEWHKYTYNNLNNKTGDLTLYWNTNTQLWDTFMNGTYHYNTNNQLDKFTSLHWNKSNKTWEPLIDTATTLTRKARIVNYYYETVHPASVANTDVQNNPLQIYPVPAAGMINIYVPFTEKQEILAVITDMAGRTIRTWKEAPATEYRGSIPVADLPPGNYLLRINGIAKQFIVQ
jgi:hypothetical protein